MTRNYIFESDLGCLVNDETKIPRNNYKIINDFILGIFFISATRFDPNET